MNWTSEKLEQLQERVMQCLQLPGGPSYLDREAEIADAEDFFYIEAKRNYDLCNALCAKLLSKEPLS